MGRLFFIVLLATTAAVSLARPWIGVVAAYGIALLTPQAVWYWNFDGLRPAMWVLAPTLLGFMFALLRKEYDLSILNNKRNWYVAGLWLFFSLSYYFGSYVDVGGPYRFTDPSWAASTLNKIFLIYFVGCVCLNDVKKLKALTGVLLVSVVYLTYWANDMYLAGRVMGRLPGPTDVYGVGTYADENCFAMLFVVGQPFLWYMGLATKNPFMRWGLWLVIPFAWHAVFLTASRGGLVGIAVVTMITVLRSKRKMLGLLLIPAFFVAYQWQAGDLMKSRADTIGEYKTETSAASRLNAWEAATKMILDHPVLGVGMSSFGPAFPDYSPEKPREAHNTFFQIAAESGAIAGLFYILIVVGSWMALRKNAKRLNYDSEDPDMRFTFLVNEAVLTGWVGLAVCSLFLSLQMFEIFYFLCLMINTVLYVSSRILSRADGTVGVQATSPRRVLTGLRGIGAARPR